VSGYCERTTEFNDNAVWSRVEPQTKIFAERCTIVELCVADGVSWLRVDAGLSFRDSVGSGDGEQ
jgi:hypothetical protein